MLTNEEANTTREVIEIEKPPNNLNTKDVTLIESLKPVSSSHA